MAGGVSRYRLEEHSTRTLRHAARIFIRIACRTVALSSWRTRFFSQNGGKSLPLWGRSFALRVHAVFHLHTFLFLSFLLAIWFITHAPSRRQLLALVAFSFVPAATLVFFVTGQFKGASVIGLHPGWMQDGQNFFVFWFTNFGVWPLLVAALCFDARPPIRYGLASRPRLSRSRRFPPLLRRSLRAVGMGQYEIDDLVLSGGDAVALDAFARPMADAAARRCMCAALFLRLHFLAGRN
jgi:hypothetical protein